MKVISIKEEKGENKMKKRIAIATDGSMEMRMVLQNIMCSMQQDIAT